MNGLNPGMIRKEVGAELVNCLVNCLTHSCLEVESTSVILILNCQGIFGHYRHDWVNDDTDQIKYVKSSWQFLFKKIQAKIWLEKYLKEKCSSEHYKQFCCKYFVKTIVNSLIKAVSKMPYKRYLKCAASHAAQELGKFRNASLIWLVPHWCSIAMVGHTCSLGIYSLLFPPPFATGSSKKWQ